MTQQSLDWPGLMRLGLGLLGLGPDQFWAMTPVELRRALEGAGHLPIGGRPIGRSTLEALMEAYPDEKE
ncbi:MAG: rcc01693 family protein [Pseudomonadota bacterium]